MRIERQKNEFKGNSKGYILDYSNSFLLLQEVDDFRVLGFLIIPIETISGVRFNKDDKYQDKIMFWEKQKEKIGITYKIDLTNWNTVFQSIKATGHNVIIEGEALNDGYFTIGPIKRVAKNAVSIQYVSTGGFLEMPLDKIDYTDITIVQFNDRYIDIFSKYLRVKK